VRLCLKPATALILSIGICAPCSDAFARNENFFLKPSRSLMSMSDRTLIKPPATFFSIDAVPAEVDRQRGAWTGCNSLCLTHTFEYLNVWRKWQGVEADMAKDQIILDRCRADLESCPSYAVQFLRLINAVKSKSGRASLDEANRAVNGAIEYVSDFVQHGEADRWSAPLATFATAKGDCEDYAIAKYVALREAGFPQDDLQLVLVRDRAVQQDHAVLAAHLDDRWLILDNRRSELINDSDASTFTPLFAINHQGVQLFAAPYTSRMQFGDDTSAFQKREYRTRKSRRDFPGFSKSLL
jgi:predicted transglutaminase-like cysteine proteinase